MPVVGFDGFEHGILSGAGFGLYDSVAGSPEIVTTPAPPYGLRRLRVNPAAASTEGVNYQPGNMTYRAIGFLFRYATGSGGGGVLSSHTNVSNNVRLDLNVSTGKIRVTSDIQAAVEATATLAADTDYWIVLVIDHLTNLVQKLRWWIDGVQQTSPVDAAVVTGAFSHYLQLHTLETYSGLDHFYDDLILADDAATGENMARRYVKGYVPSGVGAHNLDAATSQYFFKDVGGVETALTTAETTSHLALDEIPVGGDADHLVIRPAAGAPVAPVYQAAGTLSGNLGVNSVPWPVHIANDVGLLFVETAGGEDPLTPTGWTELLNSPQFNGTTTLGTRLSVYWKRAASAAEAAASIADAGDHTIAQILTFRGCPTTGDPVDATAGGAAAAGTARTLPAVTTSQVNDLIVLAITKDLDAATAFATFGANANLTALTERVDAGLTTGNGGGIAVATGGKATTGTTGTTAVTVTSSVSAWMTIALKGAPAEIQPTNTWYAEYALTDSAEVVAPSAVRVIAAIRNESLVDVNQLAVKLRANAVDGDVFNGSIGSATTIYKAAVFATAPGGAAWTDAIFDAATVRFGYTADASPQPRIEAFMAEAAFVASSAPPGTTVAVGLVTETNTALAISRQKARAVGIVSETDTALPATRRKTLAVGLIVETDTALALSRGKKRALGLASETNTGLAVTRRKTKAVGQPVETDMALAAAIRLGRTVAVGLAVETDSALAVTRAKRRAVGLVSETDTALSLQRKKARAVGLTVETATALLLVRLKRRAVGLIAETDTALAVTVRRSRVVFVGQAVESSSSLPVVARRARAVGQAVETSTVLQIGRAKVRAVGQATETSSALAVARSKLRALGIAQTSDTAFPATASKSRVVAVGQAQDAHAAFAVARRKVRTLGLATATSAAYALSRAKARLLGLAAETGTARTVVSGKLRTLGQPTEANTARPVTTTRAGALGVASELSSTLPLAKLKVRTVGLASTTDVALPASRRKVRAVGLASTSDAALPASRAKARTVALASDLNTVRPLAAFKVKALGVASTADTVYPATRRKTRTVGVASDTHTALAVARKVQGAIGQAAEASTALPVARRKTRTLALGATSEQTLTIARAKARTLGQPTEGQTAYPIVRRKLRVLAVSSTSELAQTVAARRSTTVAVGQATELGTATPVGRTKARPLGQATDTSTARPLVRLTLRTLGQPATADVALSLVGTLTPTGFVPGTRTTTSRQRVGPATSSYQRATDTSVTVRPVAGTGSIRETSETETSGRPIPRGTARRV